MKLGHLRKMDGTGDYHGKWNEGNQERQILHVPSYAQARPKKKKSDKNVKERLFWWRTSGRQEGKRRGWLVDEYDQRTFHACMKTE
jgi:hypothetical protein